jgi:molecular chaperone HscC
MRDGIFSPIIERNTVIPASRVNNYQSIQDNQERLVLDVYQGEAREVSDNIKIGTVDLPIPRRRAGEVEVDCRFTYDTSGLLEVDVTVLGTDISRQVLIFDEKDAELTSNLASRREALAKLKVHPRDQVENAAALARAKRCYEAQLGELRQFISGLIGEFEAVLAAQDERDIGEARKLLLARLDKIEGEDFL